MSEAENIGKIRDILFGNNMSEYEQRFDALEKRLQENLSEITRDFKTKMSSLENYVRDEITSLSEQLKAEKEERTKLLKKQMAEIEQVEEGLNAFKTSTAGNLREIRQQILELNSNLSDQLQMQNKDLKSLIDSESKHLNSNKMERSSLALLLTDLAYKISGEIPETEAPPMKNDEDIHDAPAAQ